MNRPLHINHEGAELLSLHADDIIYFKKEHYQTEQSLNKYYEAQDLIHKTTEYISAGRADLRQLGRGEFFI